MWMRASLPSSGMPRWNTPTVEAARSWRPEAVGLAAYLNDDVTDQPGQSMGAYWEQTRT